MGIVIYMVSIILFIVAGVLTWSKLADLETKNKIIICAISLITCIIFTLIIFGLSSIGIEYPNSEGKAVIRNTLTSIFVPINGIIFIPYIAKILIQIKNNDIDQEQMRKKLIKLLILFILVVIIEINYLKNIQLGTINVSNAMEKGN